MAYGIVPAHTYHLIWLAVPLLMWLIKLADAQKRHIRIFHNSAFAVAYWEEFLFRGLIWGIIEVAFHNLTVTLIINCVLFGLFHLRNLWWASGREAIQNCLFVTFIFAPIVGGLREWSGDIYIGIAFHALSNFVSMYITHNKIPTDQYLKSQRYKMNWFEKVFSGFWVYRNLIKRGS